MCIRDRRRHQLHPFTEQVAYRFRRPGNHLRLGAAVTWNTIPEKTAEKAAGVITKANISGDLVTVDVSEAVTDALAKGETEISFETVSYTHLQGSVRNDGADDCFEQCL